MCKSKTKSSAKKRILRNSNSIFFMYPTRHRHKLDNKSSMIKREKKRKKRIHKTNIKEINNLMYQYK